MADERCPSATGGGSRSHIKNRYQSCVSGALPITRLHVDGRECSVLIDTGSTDTIIYAPFCAQWRRRVVRVTTISGDDLKCSGIGSVTVEAPTGHRAALETLVVEERPLGVDMVLGVSGISALGGVTVLSPSVVRFCGAVCRAPPDIETPDFRVQFNAAARKCAERVVAHFAQFGLDCKPPERAASGARLLGLRVHEENGQLRWKRDNAKDGHCPPPPVTQCDTYPPPDTCHSDDFNCPGALKCCVGSCGKSCARPVFPPPPDRVKPGLCPLLTIASPCPQDGEKDGHCPPPPVTQCDTYPPPDTCHSDDFNCPGALKCCVGSCGKSCARPVFPPPPDRVKPGLCPLLTIASPCPQDGEKDGHCPPPPVTQCDTYPPPDTCHSDDFNCPGALKCCVGSCGKSCVRPVFPPDRVKPGLCPLLTIASPCPQDGEGNKRASRTDPARRE
ncbi:Antileukoproteinase [Amphibalanus amphitrite]|uniref:Antileukoproteinase n=1 Tax=Amphibalanus amphitrite TaxID=1232801 RepID=A0A6A4VBS2_AMPAM|nr:Antileukoproteinase [Amphibalanus amphitrite]